MSKLIDSRLIGKSIKNLRLSRNLTQEGLADIIGYSVRNLRRIENNGTGSIDVVNTFADIFEVSALDILNGCFLLQKIKKGIVDLRHTNLTPLIIHAQARWAEQEGATLMLPEWELPVTLEGIDILQFSGSFSGS